MKIARHLIIFTVLLSLQISAFGKIPMSFLKGKQAVENGRYRDAVEIFEAILVKPGLEKRDEARIRREMATAYIGLKDWDSAEMELRAVLKEVSQERPRKLIMEILEIVTAPEDPGVVVSNLGPKVNSPSEELAPVISPDGKTLYFIVDGDLDGEGKQDIYYSIKGEDGRWSEAANIGKPLNTKWHDGILSISPGGTSALLAGAYNIDGTKSNGYSIAHLGGGMWRDPEEMDIADYYNKNRLTSAFLAAGGKVLLLALEREDSYGDLDIYISRANPDGSWSAPMNLGQNINTRGTDGTPFLAPDGKTLYFSSDGRIGLGSQDMFKSERLDDSWKKWSKPTNLGKQVNTPGWDAYYTIPAQGDVAYFVSSAKGGYGMSDIWTIELPEIARPGAVVTVSGRVMEPDSTPVGARISWEKLATGDNIGSVRSNDLTGEYMIVLPVGEVYGYVAEKPNYLPSSAHLDLKEAEAYSEIHRDIFISPIKRGAQTVLNNIFFDFDRATLRPESNGELNRVKKILEDEQNIIVEIAGHTDSIGTAGYNKSLSAERAQSVATWLIENGIDAERLKVVGYGESITISDNSTEAGRQENRRVVFEVLDL